MFFSPLPEESLAIARELGDRLGIAYDLFYLGNVANTQCDAETEAKTLTAACYNQPSAIRGSHPSDRYLRSTPLESPGRSQEGHSVLSSGMFAMPHRNEFLCWGLRPPVLRTEIRPPRRELNDPCSQEA